MAGQSSNQKIYFAFENTQIYLKYVPTRSKHRVQTSTRFLPTEPSSFFIPDLGLAQNSELEETGKKERRIFFFRRKKRSEHPSVVVVSIGTTRHTHHKQKPTAANSSRGNDFRNDPGSRLRGRRSFPRNSVHVWPGQTRRKPRKGRGGRISRPPIG